MDTKTLVVGQKVFMKSGCYGCEGKVVKVTPLGVDALGFVHNVVEVQTVDGNQTVDGKLLQFDANGCSYVWDNNDTECGPWYIVGLISKEEIASWDGTIAKNDRQRFNPSDGRPESDGKKK